MNMNEVIKKIGEAKLRAAIESEDPSALMELFKEEGIEVSDEQLDYIAGGVSVPFYSGEDSFTIEFPESCLFPGLSCLPDGF